MLISDSSPYHLSVFVKRADDIIYYDLRGRLSWTDLDGTIPHTVEDGDTLWSIAVRYYKLHRRRDAARLWWAIADFQPTPINDPTLKLTLGSTIYVPPLTAVQAALTGGAGSELMEAL